MNEIKLYEFSEGNPETTLYVFSTLEDEAEIRSFYHINDHGGGSYEDYERVAKHGKMRRITSLDQVPENDRDIIPYSTDERYGDDYLDTDFDILEFFQGH
jgi:hypothetical protein